MKTTRSAAPAPVTLSVQINGDMLYAGADEDAAFAAWTAAARAMRAGDELKMFHGAALHLAATKAVA